MTKVKIVLIIFIIIIFAIILMSSPKSYFQKTTTTTEDNNTTTIIKNELPSKQIFISPMNDALSRITKKPFGIYISPINSPVTPEKFTGYHTGVDYETFPTEQVEDITITAICTGKVIEKKQARGYGGMVIQSCLIDNSPITIIYGHMRLSSIKNSMGEILNAGDFLGFLGTGYSAETDGERKHLHLGIHTGEVVDTRGYVQTKSELKNWIDIKEYLK